MHEHTQTHTHHTYAHTAELALTGMQTYSIPVSVSTETHRYAICNHTHSQVHTATHTHSESKHTQWVSMAGGAWCCFLTHITARWSSSMQLHAASSAAAALIPLKPHQGALAFLLNRRLSSTAAGSHHPRERVREREMERERGREKEPSTPQQHGHTTAIMCRFNGI